MAILPGLRRVIGPWVHTHQGGWDEILMFFGAPVSLFVTLRWFGLRKERREAEAAAAAGEQPDEKPDAPA